MSKLVIIDGNAIMHRAYHALPPLTTSNGEPINAVYGFIGMLLGIIEKLEPTHIVVAFDRKERLKRKDKLESYQSHRPKMDSDLDIQFFRLAQFLEAANIPAYSSAGYEADDVIGTISSLAAKLSDCREVVIITGDRDIFQLVDDKVKVYMPIKGINEGKLFSKEDVKEKMGVYPKNIVDYKALVGDASDGYPGVAGIGPKTAVNLIDEFGSFENVYKNIDKISGKVSVKLDNGKDMGMISLELAHIDINVPIEWDIKDASGWDIDSQDVLDLFTEFGFKTLTERVKKVGQMRLL